MSKTGKKTKQNKKRRDCGYVLFIHVLWVVLLFVLLAIFINNKQNRKTEWVTNRGCVFGSLAKDPEMTKKVRSKDRWLSWAHSLTHTRASTVCASPALPPGGVWPAQAGQVGGIILTSSQEWKRWKEHRLWDQTVLGLTLGSNTS